MASKSSRLRGHTHLGHTAAQLVGAQHIMRIGVSPPDQLTDFHDAVRLIDLKFGAFDKIEKVGLKECDGIKRGRCWRGAGPSRQHRCVQRTKRLSE
jgi:hypothetical protein